MPPIMPQVRHLSTGTGPATRLHRAYESRKSVRACLDRWCAIRKAVTRLNNHRPTSDKRRCCDHTTGSRWDSIMYMHGLLEA
jgi:hypothetical protein